MNKKRLRARADAAFDELDDEVEELDSVEADERADLLRRFEEMKSDSTYQKSKAKAKPDSVSVSGKTKDIVSSKPDSSSSKTKRYDDSVTKTTTTPTTRKGRKGTETKTVTSGTMTGGKSDNPEMQKQHDWFRIKNKYGGMVRSQGRAAVRKQIAGSSASPEDKAKDLELFDNVFRTGKK
tara:strand:+ start:1755 stop:2294 length:540 start_codon:yes stop_codon:yes gene_type:complete